VTSPINGDVTPPVNGVVNYTPQCGFVGQDSFSFEATDENGVNSNVGTVTVGVVASVGVQSLTLDRNQVIGGSIVMATVTLTGPAPPCGLPVNIRCDPAWPITGFLPSPVASATSPQIVPEGQMSMSFLIRTVEVFMPFFVTVRAATVPQQLTVLPPIIPQQGPQADARVAQILLLFENATGGDHQAALDDIVAFRKTSPAAGQDVYLAAADHHHFAMVWTINHPTQFPLVQGFIPAYEVVKAFADLSTTEQPTSPSTILSVQWGEEGVVDGLGVLFGSDLVKGNPAGPVGNLPSTVVTP
jgi:hypothetical protein